MKNHNSKLKIHNSKFSFFSALWLSKMRYAIQKPKRWSTILVYTHILIYFLKSAIKILCAFVPFAVLLFSVNLWKFVAKENNQ